MTDGSPTPRGADDVMDAFLRASRLLVALSTRSIDESTSPVTIAQFRALLVISRGEVGNQAQLATELGVAASSVTRMIERLENAGLVSRTRSTGGARGFALSVTAEGREVVDTVTATRRQMIAEIVDRMGLTRRSDLIAALEEFSEAGGEPPVGLVHSDASVVGSIRVD